MTRRDYFAGVILSALIDDVVARQINKGNKGSMDSQIAKAWKFADQMDTSPGAKGRPKTIQVETDLSLKQVIVELKGLNKQLERLADAQIETNRILSDDKIQT